MNDDHLERLSLKLGDSWEALARRLGFEEADIEEFNTRKQPDTAKRLTMLQKWKRRLGSGATYKVLWEALCHEFVGRRDLAEMFCIQFNHVAECSAWFNSSAVRFKDTHNTGNHSPC